MQSQHIIPRLSADDIERKLEGARLLGHGLYGKVYQVGTPGDYFALKVFVSKNSMQKEVGFLRKVSGAGGAPQVLSYCENPPAVMMTLLEGKTLDRVIHSYKPSDELQLNLALKVVRVVMEVHATGVVHRDIKWDNFMVRLDDAGYPHRVHILDFGLSREIGERYPPRRSLDIPNFNCNCIAFEAKAQPACDVFSLGYMFRFWARDLAGREARLQLSNLAQKMTQRRHRDQPMLLQVKYDLERIRHNLPSEVNI